MTQVTTSVSEVVDRDPVEIKKVDRTGQQWRISTEDKPTEYEENVYFNPTSVTGSVMVFSTSGITGLRKPIIVAVIPLESKEVTSEHIEVLEGEVEKIESETALVVFKTGNGYIERQIPLRRLVAKGADYEGARVRISVKEYGGTVLSQLEKIDDDAKPVWATDDEEMMETFRRLKNSLSLNKKR